MCESIGAGYLISCTRVSESGGLNIGFIQSKSLNLNNKSIWDKISTHIILGGLGGGVYVVACDSIVE